MQVWRGRYSNVSLRRTGLPAVVKMRHDAHYVEEIISRSGAAIGRMIPIEQITPNADQPRKDRGDLRGLTESVRDKGVLEPLLVRHLPETGRYMIISGERRFHAARAAGLRELPCIEKDVNDAETLEIALIENLQRKDLTPFEEADGLQALAERFGLNHEEIAQRLAKGRSSVTEVLSLRAIPDEVKTLKAKTKEAIDLFGTIHGYDLVDTKPIGERLMRATYLSLGHELPLRWRFYFYKAETTWKLIDIRVDDKLTGIFDEAMEEVPRPDIRP